MDLPFRYLPATIFNECARLLNPSTAKYSWQELAQKLGFPIEDIRYIESSGVTDADSPPAALVLRYFQYGGFIEKGKLPKHRGGSLATIIEKLGEFPRADVIELLNDADIIKVMQDEFSRDMDSNNNEQKAPVEDSDPQTLDGFLRESTTDSKPSKDHTGDSDNVNIKLAEANIRINRPGKVIIYVSRNDVNDTFRTLEQNGGASRFYGSDNSGSGTPSPGESPPLNGARPKERTGGNSRRSSGGTPGQSGPLNGYHTGRGPRRPSGTFNRQDSNTSVSSCELLLPVPPSHKDLITDTDSETSSLNSGDIVALTEQLESLGGSKEYRGCQCKRNSDPLLVSRSFHPVPLKTQISENDTEATRGRNNSEPNVPHHINGPVLIICDPLILKNDNSRKILISIGRAIRNRFKPAGSSDAVQFSLWNPERYRYSRDRDIHEEIDLSLEKTSLIVIFANSGYLKAIEEVEQSLHKNANFIPPAKPGKCNVHYVYQQLQIRAKHQQLMSKIAIFCKEDTKDRLPVWLRNLGTVAPWPVDADDVIRVLWPLLTKQAKIIRRGFSYPLQVPCPEKTNRKENRQDIGPTMDEVNMS